MMLLNNDYYLDAKTTVLAQQIKTLAENGKKLAEAVTSIEPSASSTGDTVIDFR